MTGQRIDDGSDEVAFLRDVARKMHATVTATEADVLAAVKEVSAHAAKFTARAMAQQRARAVRDLARDCARLAERVDRCRLSGGDWLREAAGRYAHVADNLDATLRGR